MRTILLPLLLTVGYSRLPAQLYQRLAEEVCNCMEGITDEPPRSFARNCLRIVGRRNRPALERELDFPFDPSRSADLDVLAAQLLRPLATSCPLLQALHVPRETSELRWSDQRPEIATDRGDTYAKDPPPDTADRISGERPPEVVVSGTVTEIGRQWLSIRTSDGAMQRVHGPARRLRVLQPKVGQPIRVSCRREWLLEEGRVRLVVQLPSLR